MGDEFSDWEGVEYTFTSGAPLVDGSAESKQNTLQKMTISNDRLNDSVDEFSISDSSFSGFVSMGDAYSDTAVVSDPDLCVVTMIRVI